MRVRNYDIFSGHAWYVPGIGGVLLLAVFLLIGALLSGIVTLVATLTLPAAAAGQVTLLLGYPLMFIPAMVFVRARSQRNALFDKGWRVDNRHFGPGGAWLTAPAVVLATLAMAFVMDWSQYVLPPIPEALKAALEMATQGPLWMNILVTCLFAPFFEEWLCRGMVLRGLLHCERSGGRRGIAPWAAIVLSALFFGLIHLNPWQAIPAFALGCLFGYVYYKTGSLKLTMLMHAANNGLALASTRIDALKDMQSWLDVMTSGVYATVTAGCALVIVIVILLLRRISCPKAGNCDPV